MSEGGGGRWRVLMSKGGSLDAPSRRLRLSSVERLLVEVREEETSRVLLLPSETFMESKVGVLPSFGAPMIDSTAVCNEAGSEAVSSPGTRSLGNFWLGLAAPST